MGEQKIKGPGICLLWGSFGFSCGLVRTQGVSDHVLRLQPWSSFHCCSFPAASGCLAFEPVPASVLAETLGWIWPCKNVIYETALHPDENHCHVSALSMRLLEISQKAMFYLLTLSSPVWFTAVRSDGGSKVFIIARGQRQIYAEGGRGTDREIERSAQGGGWLLDGAQGIELDVKSGSRCKGDCVIE